MIELLRRLVYNICIHNEYCIIDVAIN